MLSKYDENFDFRYPKISKMLPVWQGVQKRQTVQESRQRTARHADEIFWLRQVREAFQKKLPHAKTLHQMQW